MDTVLEVTPRDQQAKGASRKARAKGIVPAVLYGPNREPQSVAVDPVRLVDLFKQTGNRNTIVMLKVADSEPVPCLVREVQRHPVSREILHVDFFAVPPDREIEVMVPLAPHGRPKGALLGGRLRLIRREVRVICRYDRIPESIAVDVSPLEIGDFVKASAMPLSEGVSLASEHDYNVLSIVGKKAGKGAELAETQAS